MTDNNTQAQNTQKVVARVQHEYEAQSAVEALSGANIASAYRLERSTGLFAMPGAMGIPDKCYEILVAEKDEARANEVLVGIGTAEPSVDTPDESQSDAPADTDAASFDADSNTDETAAADEQPEESTVSRIGLLLLVLVLVALVTWGVDAIIDFVKQLLAA